MSRRTRNHEPQLAYVSPYVLQSASPAVRAAITGLQHQEPSTKPQPQRWPLSWRILWLAAKVIVALWATGYLVFALGLMWLLLTTKV